MRISITLTKTFRRNLVFVLNLVKNLIFSVGIIAAIFFSMGLDTVGEGGDIAIAGAFISLGVTLVGMILEIFIVTCLLRDGEHINTIFDFEFYGLRSSKAYKAYRREIRKNERLNLLNSNNNRMAS